jgi:hypothetical protein
MNRFLLMQRLLNYGKTRYALIQNRKVKSSYFIFVREPHRLKLTIRVVILSYRSPPHVQNHAETREKAMLTHKLHPQVLMKIAPPKPQLEPHSAG